MAIQSISLRPSVPFFPSHINDLFSVSYCGKKYELNAWQKVAITIVSLAGILLAGIGIVLGFCVSQYFRNRLVDQLLTQQAGNKENVDPLLTQQAGKKENVDHFFFDAQYFNGTNNETLAPVASTELFYQQKQVGSCCSIHALCNFAGHNIDRLVPMLIKCNNDFWSDVFVNKWNVPQAEAIEGMRELGVYMDMEQGPFMNGMSSQPFIKFIEQNKDSLHLPQTCDIEFHTGLINGEKIKAVIQNIQARPDLHRIFIFILQPISHVSAIRKDNAGQWRVLDGMSNPDELQLRFGTLQEAVFHFLKNHHAENNSVSLFYPTEDTPENALKIFKSGDLSKNKNTPDV